jgi:sporulation protein YlmC with PRC-barrel domain
MKRFALTAIIIGLAAPVYAQTGQDTSQNKAETPSQSDQTKMAPESPAPSGSMSSQGAAAPSASPSTSAEATTPSTASPPATSPSASADASANGERFLKTQSPDQWLASRLIGQNVYNSAGESIGNLNDVLVSKDGAVVGVLVGVGGFLGLGEKNVAVNYDMLKQNGGISGERIVLGLTKDELRAAPTFERIDRTRTASGTATTTPGAGGTASSSGTTRTQ